MCKPLGVSLHTVSNGAAPPPAVLQAAAVLPAYSALPLMPGFLGAPHPATVTPSPVTHTHAATPDWNTYYYVSRKLFFHPPSKKSLLLLLLLLFLFLDVCLQRTHTEIQTFHFMVHLLPLMLWEMQLLTLRTCRGFRVFEMKPENRSSVTGGAA